jgi:hypothetical protein
MGFAAWPRRNFLEGKEMNDTHPKIAALYKAMFARLSPEERAMRGCSMHDFSKKIVLSQIESPGKTQADVMIELFIRFYGKEFQGRSLEQILNAIRRHHSQQPVGSPKSTSPSPFTVVARP